VDDSRNPKKQYQHAIEQTLNRLAGEKHSKRWKHDGKQIHHGLGSKLRQVNDSHQNKQVAVVASIYFHLASVLFLQIPRLPLHVAAEVGGEDCGDFDAADDADV